MCTFNRVHLSRSNRKQIAISVTGVRAICMHHARNQLIFSLQTLMIASIDMSILNELELYFPFTKIVVFTLIRK